MLREKQNISLFYVLRLWRQLKGSKETIRNNSFDKDNIYLFVYVYIGDDQMIMKKIYSSTYLMWLYIVKYLVLYNFELYIDLVVYNNNIYNNHLNFLYLYGFFIVTSMVSDYV